jgi:hypothetical protein
MAGGTLGGTRTPLALPTSGQTGSKTETDTTGKGLGRSDRRFVIGGTGTLGESRQSHQGKSQGGENDVFNFVHFYLLLFICI